MNINIPGMADVQSITTENEISLFQKQELNKKRCEAHIFVKTLTLILPHKNVCYLSCKV